MSGVAVALVGATATGKSVLAHAVARQDPRCEIVAVDAMTVYRGMDLATAKATPAERLEVTYHLLDLVGAHEEFTVAQYQRAARRVTDDAWSRGQRVIYVGGTGLYLRAVLDDLEIPGQFDEVRRELEARVMGGEDLYSQLTRVDPVAATRLEPSNVRRVVRALEVTLGSGRPFSTYGPGLATYAPARVVQVGLRVPVEELDARIERRFHQWMRDGLLDEVRRLVADPRGLSRTARQAVGYRQMLAHLEEGLDLNAAVEASIAQSRRLARRQRSWFNRDPRIEWFEDPLAAAQRVTDVLNGADGDVRDWRT